MVSVLVKKFPTPASQQPLCLSFFWDDIYKPRKYMTLNEIKEIAFYNYSHPLFFDKIKVVHFVYKVYEIRNRDTATFDHFIALDGYYPKVSMTSWTQVSIPILKHNPSSPQS
ncbi:hypothetical protein RHMOL_Rhmol13G0303700 [Rhododendron molle]|uniref:Uncharacterized protein n=1 Tax=Rhododendron molle TaxID=49168 RepID=A0ACC0LCD6_RHOML|nr:hypothetical protein RHMOL_Rhmol13G0303700 [Rhododendron molle]